MRIGKSTNESSPQIEPTPMAVQWRPLFSCHTSTPTTDTCRSCGTMDTRLPLTLLRKIILAMCFVNSPINSLTNLLLMNSHRSPELWWTFNATMEDWFDEFAGMANIINRFAGIPLDELRGTRVPFLRVGWNTQFIMVMTAPACSSHILNTILCTVSCR